MRARQVGRLFRREWQTFRYTSTESGARDALVARARHLLGLDDLEARALSLAAESRRLGEVTRQLEGELRRLRQESAETRNGLIGTHRHFEAGLALIDRHNQVTSLHALVEPVTAWVRQTTLDRTPPISVVLATRNRVALLRRAIESVQAQDYPSWELVVVDHASHDGTAKLLADLASEDSRIVVVSQQGGTVGTARNAGLSAASGELVTYLDDDNVMQPLWLKAVAWACERQPEVDVRYGARVTDVDRPGGGPAGGLPFLQLESFDRARLELGNFIDLGVLAHRRDLPEAIFDENLERLSDWDLVLRLTESRIPLALPVVASLYTTSAPDRISRSRRGSESEAIVRAKLARARPLRMLAYNSLFPLVPETYIADEMRALTDNGVALAWCTDRWSASPVRVAEPAFTNLDRAVAEFRPDALFVFWATFADERLDELSRIGLPFAVRVHSFDFDTATVARVQAHPLCVGIWAYPHHARLIPGARDLVPLLTDLDVFPEPAAARTIVLSASAGLPKKDWPTLVGAFAALSHAGADCRIVVGRTHLHEDEPEVVRALIRESGAAVMLSVDVPHDQVIGLLGRTAAVVYSKRGPGPMGMPRSIVEGMYAGASVIMPDRPESSSTGGPHCRRYGRQEDIVQHVTEILAGGPAVEAERRANREFVDRHFVDPALGAAFTSQLYEAVARWRAR
jgi:glycosyltransferase involved in cell wall biosynthesis